ncbi:MAG: hypothetical protein V4714_20090 [Bacteroidota bacterium]
MKNLLIIPFVMLIAVGAYAQKKGKKENKENINVSTPTTLRSPKSEAPAVDLKFLPLFGGQPRSAAQQQEDQAFLADCDRSFSTREEASKFFETRAWEYLQEGKSDTAIYRFNLAWLLNNKSVNVYWGLGAIAAEKGKNDNAIELLEKGLALEPNNSALLADVASVRLNKYKVKSDKKELKTSFDLLQKSIQADSTNGGAYLKMSVVYFHQEEYDKAWEYLHKGTAMQIGGLDIGYLAELIAKKPDPQGKFK